MQFHHENIKIHLQDKTLMEWPLVLSWLSHTNKRQIHRFSSHVPDELGSADLIAEP